MRRDWLRLALGALIGIPLVAVVGVLLGGVLAGFFGAAGLRDLVVLAAGGVLSALVAHRFVPERSRPLLPAICVQGAHAVWLLSLLVHGQLGGLIDVLAIVGPLAWLAARPGRWPAIALLGGHAIQAVLLLLQWLGALDPGALLPLFVSHMALRAAGVALTLRALEVISRRDAQRASRSAGGAPRP